MTFFQFNWFSKKGWYTWEELPKDVQADLFKRLEKCDRRIGLYVYHSHDSKGQFQGMQIGYYVRTLVPQMYAEDKWWKARRMGGGLV